MNGENDQYVESESQLLPSPWASDFFNDRTIL